MPQPSFHELFCSSSDCVAKPVDITQLTEESPVEVIKTHLQILEEGCKKVYGRAPEFQVIKESIENNVATFVFSCYIMGVKTEGEGKTKKIAKQYAAREMLRAMVKKDRYVEFGIPGKTQQEAYEFIDNMPDPGDKREGEVPASTEAEDSNDQTAKFNPGANWIGKLQSLAQKYKLETAIYESTEDGPPNDKTFHTTCKILNKECVGSAKLKKVSKNIAAWKMFTQLESSVGDFTSEKTLIGDDVVAASVDDGPPKDDADGKVILNKAWLEVDPIEKVEAFLSDSKCKDVVVEYKFLENLAKDKKHQCLAKASFKFGDAPYNLVGVGANEDKEEARKSGARILLGILNTLS